MAEQQQQEEKNSSQHSLYNSQCLPSQCIDEVRHILVIAAPACITGIPLAIQSAVSAAISGHLSVKELSAIGLANSLSSMLGNCIGRGHVFALETYFSQTFGSADKQRMGLFLQRGLVIMAVTFLLIFCCFINTRHLLPLFGQDLVISEMTVIYTLLLSPGLASFFLFIALTSYLQMQGITLPSMIVSILGMAVNIGSQLIAVKVLKFRYESSAVCQSLASTLTTFCLLLYIIISKVYKKTWSAWSLQALKDIWPMTRLGMLGMTTLVLEVIPYEVGVLVMGSVSLEQLAAQTIIVTFSWTTVVFNFGLCVAVTARVGNQLGAGDPYGARFSYRVGLALGATSGTLLCIFYASLRKELPKIFTSDPDVIEQAADGFLYYLLVPIFEDLGMMAVGALKGCGLQYVSAVSTAIAFLPLALPIGIPLALLTPMKCGGLWIGITCGTAVRTIILLVVTCRIDWEKEANKAAERVTVYTCTEEGKLVNKESQPILAESPKNDSISFSKSEILVRVIAGTALMCLLIASILHYLLENPLQRLPSGNNTTKFSI